jgi:ferric-dicitrate binding protein FerR (iron transport regulator)
MIEHDDEVARLLAPLREPLPAEPLETNARAEAMRARVLSALRTQVMELPEAQVRRDATRKQRTWLATGTGGLALAAAAMLVFLERPAEKPAASTTPSVARNADEGSVIEDAQWVSADGYSHPIVQGMLVPEGSRELRAGVRAARVRTQVGAEVQLAPNTRLSVQEDAALRVLDGEVACSVPKLGKERSFSIDTPSARVVVHGTRFTVRVTGSERERTCVRVQEGVVAVHAHRAGAAPVRLLAGDAWGCDEAPAKAARPATVSRKANPAQRPSASNAARGTLDAENRLLADALSAERADDRARAHALFNELLARHPGSPLATEARAGLQRTR